MEGFQSLRALNVSKIVLNGSTIKNNFSMTATTEQKPAHKNTE
jgi:hypothetical protein